MDKNTAWLGGSIQTSGGNKGIIYYTSDGGVNWEPQYTSETSTSIYSIHFINASIGWAVGSGGEIIKTTTGGVTSIYDGTEELNSFRLLQNYPNPFNPNTKINYSIPKTCFVTLKVYDLLGKEVLYLVNEEKPEGYYEVEFNGALLSSGVYLYSIQAGNFSDTKKFILLR
ncbi:MAG: T9SS type A sorting domain-containing protein [Bacteroidetes bacterium]|nr:T9SS type A sorting domain-containing protein [Bacteroidota bacterium]